MAAALPGNLKPINPFIKLAKEYDKRDPIVAYYCRMYAVQKGIKIDSKSPESKKFLFGLMDQLEAKKKELSVQNDEALSSDVVAQAHVETVAVQLFSWADNADRNSIFNRNVTKAFYSSNLLFEVITQFGELNDECKVQQKYAKWKATYLHKCSQTGETPIPGPEGSGFENELSTLDLGEAGPSSSYPTSTVQPGMPMPEVHDPYRETSIQPVPAPRAPVNPTPPTPTTVESDATENIDFDKALKYTKYATSALQYEDVSTAIENLTLALKELKK